MFYLGCLRIHWTTLTLQNLTNTTNAENIEQCQSVCIFAKHDYLIQSTCCMIVCIVAWVSLVNSNGTFYHCCHVNLSWRFVTIIRDTRLFLKRRRSGLDNPWLSLLWQPFVTNPGPTLLCQRPPKNPWHLTSFRLPVALLVRLTVSKYCCLYYASNKTSKIVLC